MKNIFNNSITRLVRDEANDRKKPKESKSDSPPSTVAPATLGYYPSPSATVGDSYSHTANSTAGYSQTNTYPTLTNYHQQSERPSLLGRIEATATSLAGNLVGQDTAVSVTNKLNSMVTSGSNARELLRPGAIVQLMSKSSGQLIQVVMSSNGVLVFDGTGASNAFNTYFTVEEGEKGRLRFHNSCNYLAIDGKQACVMSFPPGPKNNPKIDFRVHDILGSTDLVSLESCASKNCFLSISSDGHLRAASNKDKTTDAQFSVIYVPMFAHPAQPQMNPYGGFPASGATGYAYSQPPAYHQQLPSAPPAPEYSVHDSHDRSTASSSLYPQIH